MGNMSLLGGEGPYCISVLWGLTALLFVVLIIRIYTRVVCVASYGIDDTFFVITIVSTTFPIATNSRYTKPLLTVAAISGGTQNRPL